MDISLKMVTSKIQNPRINSVVGESFYASSDETLHKMGVSNFKHPQGIITIWATLNNKCG